MSAQHCLRPCRQPWQREQEQGNGTLGVKHSGQAWPSLLLMWAEASPMAQPARGAGREHSPLPVALRAGDQRSQALRTAGPPQPSLGGQHCSAAAYHPNICLRAPVGTSSPCRPLAHPTLQILPLCFKQTPPDPQCTRGFLESSTEKKHRLPQSAWWGTW